MNNTLKNEIHVGIGELKTGTNGDVLKAILGSCVGIAFRVPSMNKYALAHCFLPYPKEPSTEFTGKFVTLAVPSLFCALGLTRFDAPLIEAIVAGGAAMQGNSASRILRIGEMNVEMALKMLEQHKVKIIHQDLGLTHGRQLILNCDDGSFQVRNLNILEETGS